MNDVSNIVVPSSPEDRKAIVDVLKDISNVKTQIEASRDYITEAIAELSEKYDLPKKYVRKMAKVYHSQTLSEELQEMEEFGNLYEQIVGGV